MKPISSFLDECCILARNAKFPALELYLTYVHWCLNTGIPVQDQFAFMDLLECQGLKYRERKEESFFKGIAVLPAYRMEYME